MIPSSSLGENKTSTISLVRITLQDGTQYHEVGVLDTRPLDLRKHKWRVVDSLLTERAGRDLYDATVDAIRAGLPIRVSA